MYHLSIYANLHQRTVCVNTSKVPGGAHRSTPPVKCYADDKQLHQFIGMTTAQDNRLLQALRLVLGRIIHALACIAVVKRSRRILTQFM